MADRGGLEKALHAAAATIKHRFDEQTVKRIVSEAVLEALRSKKEAVYFVVRTEPPVRDVIDGGTAALTIEEFKEFRASVIRLIDEAFAPAACAFEFLAREAATENKP